MQIHTNNLDVTQKHSVARRFKHCLVKVPENSCIQSSKHQEWCREKYSKKKKKKKKKKKINKKQKNIAKK